MFANKYSVVLACACSLLFLAACSKDDAYTRADGMVKTIDSVVMDVQIGMIQLDDGNFVVVSNEQMVKLDSRGNVLWKKPVTNILDTRAGVADPGNGFILFGAPVNPPTPGSYYACRYDAEGNLLATKQVNLNYPSLYTELPISIIKLSGGGFALAFSNSYSWNGALKILDSDFNLVYASALSVPAGCDYFLVQHICEMPNGDLAIAAAIGHSKLSAAWINSAIVVAEQNGTIKSLHVMGDTVSNHLTNTVSTCTGGFFAASSRMNGLLSGLGSIVNYYGGNAIAGTLQIDRFNSEGQFTGSRKLTGYQGFGIIKSIRKTSDGGYLLCGTTGISGSTVAVSATKIFVCKLDAGLNQSWTKSFETTYKAIGSVAMPLTGGECLVAGNMKTSDVDYQMLIIRTDANGEY